MIQVTTDSFIATVCQLDVIPSLARSPRYDRITGYVTTWETRSGNVLGKSDGGTTFMPSRFFVTESFYESNKSKLTKEPS